MTSTPNDELSRALHYSEAELAAARARIAELEADDEMWRQTVYRLQATVNTLTAELADARRQLAEARTDRDKWHNKHRMLKNSKPTYATYNKGVIASCRGKSYRPVPTSTLATTDGELCVMHRDGGGNWEGEQ